MSHIHILSNLQDPVMACGCTVSDLYAEIILEQAEELYRLACEIDDLDEIIDELRMDPE